MTDLYTIISSIDCLPASPYSPSDHKITIGYHVSSSETLAIMCTLRVSDSEPPVIILDSIKSLQFSIYVHMYRDSLYTLNGTHLSKYSLITKSKTPLYIHPLLTPTMELVSIKNVEKYMLIIHSQGYFLLDIEFELLQLLIDKQKNPKFSSGSHLFSVDSKDISDIVVYKNDFLLIGVGVHMRTYNRNLRVSIGEFPIRTGRIYGKYAIELLSKNEQHQEILNIGVIVDYESEQVWTRGSSIK